MNGGVAAIAIGSESSGGVHGVFVNNITAANVWHGVNIKTCRGRGGVVENVHISNVKITTVSRDYSINMYPLYTYGCVKHPDVTKVTDQTPSLRDVYITNLTGSSKRGFAVVGLPEKHFSNIQIKNVHLTAEHDEVITNVDDLLLSNFTYTRVQHL